MLTTDDAETIAKKLQADVKKKRKRHVIAIIRVNGKEVGRFGIRRGSGNLPHHFIPQQIHVTNQQAVEIKSCTKSRPEYEDILRLNGHYPTT
jgi:hypothetical protein